MNARKTSQFDLGHRSIAPAQPGDQGQGDELQIGEISQGKRSINFPLIVHADTPDHKADGIFRRTEGYFFKHPVDNFSLAPHLPIVVEKVSNELIFAHF